VDAGTISYIEAHGTGTQMGDPIEVTALTKALDTGDLKNGRCAIGSVKGNVGHLDRAAGVAGFIKTALALKHRLIPPSLNYTEPNPKIDFQNSPFYVNTSLVKWETADVPRRAGISSLGFGGTNVHIILEEPPELAEELQEEKLKLPERPYKLLLLSARNQSALDEATGNLRAYLMQNENVSLDDLAYTLQVGRKDFEYRRALVCCDIQQAASALESMDSCRVATDRTDPDNRSAVFMFPGQGVQYIGMAAELYNTEPYFREQVNLCRDILKNHMDTDLLSLIYPGEGDKEEAEQKLSQTRYSQPAIFVMEYALAKLLIKWGIQPSYMIGHSLGEYTAACISGVMALEDALTLVAARGRMIQELRRGQCWVYPSRKMSL
jgi:acyl transferase domain-containing protein